MPRIRYGSFSHVKTVWAQYLKYGNNIDENIENDLPFHCITINLAGSLTMTSEKADESKDLFC